MKEWTIGGMTIMPGEKKQFNIEPNVPGYQMPATAICGAEEGSSVVITAGIHSGEYPGVAALIRVARELDASQIKGRILLIHCVNTSGFWAKSPGRVPEDGANLNANYPGDPYGGVGDMIAHYFVKEIFPQADFLIDLHSGGQMEPLTPCLFFPAAAGEEVRRRSEAAARATDIPYLIASIAKAGEYSYAASLGIPGLLLERGHSGHCQENWIQAYQNDIRLLLAHLGSCECLQLAATCEKTVFEKTVYLTADRKGIWYPDVTADVRVEKGQRLGHLEDFFGNTLQTYVAEADGRVFYHSAGLATNAGDPLLAYGMEEHAHC